jgi:hypothetical protein
VTKSQDRPRRQKRRPAEFREKPEPREPPAHVVATEPEDPELMAALYGPDWRKKP